MQVACYAAGAFLLGESTEARHIRQRCAEPLLRRAHALDPSMVVVVIELAGIEAGAGALLVNSVRIIMVVRQLVLVRDVPRSRCLNVLIAYQRRSPH